MLDDLNDILNTRLIQIGEHELNLGQVLALPLMLIIGYFLIRAMVRTTEAAMENRNVNPDVIQVTKRAVTVIGLIALTITLLDYINVPLTAFAFVSGAVAIGVGFGAQNIINNFISGWILMWERPIRISDFIEVGPTMGTVERINTRSTQIRRVDGVHLLVPNSQLLEQTVVNWTLVDKLLRCIVRVGVAYGSDVRLVEQLLKTAAVEHEMILADPEPLVIFEDFGDNSLVFDVYFWVQSVGERSARQVRSEYRFTVDEIFREHDVVIAFPQRDMHVDGTLRVQQVEPDR